jgi:hypothetical protein
MKKRNYTMRANSYQDSSLQNNSWCMENIGNANRIGERYDLSRSVKRPL